jgi:hypothetical protein
VLEHISMIASMKGMAVTQHKIVRIPDMLITDSVAGSGSTCATEKIARFGTFSQIISHSNKVAPAMVGRALVCYKAGNTFLQPTHQNDQGENRHPAMMS